MIKLALTDLDDTLIRNGLPHASERALQAIHEMLDAGLRFGPVSGRVPNAMEWMFAGDARAYECGALSNGQMIYLDGELLHAETIDAELLFGVACTLSEFEGCALCIYDVDVPEEGSGYFVSPSASHLEGVCQRFRHIGRGVTHLTEDTYIKANVWCSGDRERVTMIRDLLREAYPALDFVFPSPCAPLIDISPAGWSKGTAVRYLADELGLSLDEVATFGDSENDLSMIECVPNSVAVSNASPEVAKAARWHIGASADDAVADALHEIAVAAQSGAMPAFMYD